MGRVTYQKGPHYFIEAAKKILEKRSDVHFVMSGNGDLMHSVIERVAQLKIASNFHFTGFLKHDEIENIFALADVYVMPSVSEPFGIAPLEALSYNVPVIISKQSGVSEILHNALKINFWDIDALANQICALLDYKALKQELLEKSAHELKNIQWEKAANNIIEHYNALLNA